MKTVKIKKSVLVEVVSRNMQQHREQFEKAFDGYRRECESVLSQNLENLKMNRRHVVRFSEIPPEDHTDDYRRVLAMLDMSVDDVIELTNQEFQQYVQDDWNWKSQWIGSNSKYYQE